MRIHVCSRIEMYSKTLPRSKHAVISISDPKSAVPTINVNVKTLGVLYLKFWDVDRDIGPRYRPMPDGDHARQILRFARAALKDGAKDLFVHCEAGISRSSATAQALRDVFGWRVQFELHPIHHRPNALLHRLILEEA